jgi:hypothetical protein
MTRFVSGAGAGQASVVARVSVLVTDLESFSFEEHGIRSRDLKQLSRHMRLAVAAALRCRALADLDEERWASLPLIVACPTGAEIGEPFRAAVREVPIDARSAACSEVIARGGVNVLDLLRLSAGTMAGSVAKLAGPRARNASCTGYAADHFALRKAARWLQEESTSLCLIVGGESGRESGGGCAEAGVALLAAKQGPGRGVVSTWTGERDGGLGARFEAISLLTGVAELLDHGRDGDVSLRDPYQRVFCGRVDVAGASHA